MKYLGEGFEYKVFDLENGRVFKKPLPLLASLFKLYGFARARERSGVMRSCRLAVSRWLKNRRKIGGFKERLKFLPAEIFARPEFIGSTLRYTQDKTTALEDVFRDRPGEGAAVIDAYLRLQEKLWSYSLHDPTYKFQKNYGLDARGEVVCIDPGEFVFDKQSALGSVRGRKWLKRASYRDWDNRQLKEYYTEAMNAAMTEERLDKLWGAGEVG